MIKIKFGKDYEATFSGERWRCDDKDVQRVLNGLLDLDEVRVSDAYRTCEYDSTVHGLDGVALDAVAFLGPDLVGHEPDEVSVEEKGVVN